MIKKVFYIHRDQHRKLQELSDRLGIPQADILRDGLDKAIDLAEKKADLLEKHFGAARLIPQPRPVTSISDAPKAETGRRTRTDD